MRKYTVNQIFAMSPCKSYTKKKLLALWDEREALDVHDFTNLSIPTEDILWVLCSTLGKNDPTRARLYACDCLEYAIKMYPEDELINARARGIIENARKLLRENADNSEYPKLYDMSRGIKGVPYTIGYLSYDNPAKCCYRSANARTVTYCYFARERFEEENPRAHPLGENTPESREETIQREFVRSPYLKNAYEEEGRKIMRELVELHAAADNEDGF